MTIGSKEWLGIPDRTYYTNYGRCIRVTSGLFVGLIIDKSLFILTKGASIVIPPFSALLIARGKVLFSVRFERKFGKIGEYLLKHITKTK
jgi:hypothetical protein